MWKPIYAVSKTGKRYVNSYSNTDTGEILSNRKYQEQFGSVAKKGFRTIEKKAEASPTAKSTKVTVQLNKIAHTAHFTYPLDINGDWIQQILNIIEESGTDVIVFFLRMEIWIRGVGHTVFVGTHATDDIELLLEEIQELINDYEFDGIKAAWLTIVKETR